MGLCLHFPSVRHITEIFITHCNMMDHGLACFTGVCSLVVLWLWTFLRVPLGVNLDVSVSTKHLRRLSLLTVATRGHQTATRWRCASRQAVSFLLLLSAKQTHFSKTKITKGWPKMQQPQCPGSAAICGGSEVSSDGADGASCFFFIKAIVSAKQGLPTNPTLPARTTFH